MRQRVLFFTVVLALALSGCQSTANGLAVGGLVQEGPVAALVGGRSISVADFERRLAEVVRGLEGQGATPEQITELDAAQNIRSTIFDRMLQDELLMLYARRNGIGVDPSAIDAAALAQANEADPVAASNPAAQRVSLARSQLVFEVIARNTRADMYRARQILLTDQATADQVLAELQAGKLFADLARQYSQDSNTVEQGGERDWSPRGDFVPAVDEAAFTVELNTPTKVETEFGVFILEVLERQEQRPFDSFSQLQQSQGAQQFFEATFQPWYDQLFAEAQASGDIQLTPGFDPNTVPLLPNNQ